MQAVAQADLERIRKEATEIYERETRLLRETRDAALDDAARTKAELRDLTQQHDDLVVAHRETVARTDMRAIELQGELKLKSFELQRVQVGSWQRDKDTRLSACDRCWGMLHVLQHVQMLLTVVVPLAAASVVHRCAQNCSI